jgi:V-type H+-transporting ATPase subunit F
MSAAKTRFRPGEPRLVGVIGDEDTVTGFILAGAGHADDRKGLPPNYFVVNKQTQTPEIEAAFKTMVSRADMALILICQHVANDIRYAIDQHTETFPCVLEIPSKDTPFDPSKDPVLAKLNRALGK